MSLSCTFILFFSDHEVKWAQPQLASLSHSVYRRILRMESRIHHPHFCCSCRYFGYCWLILFHNHLPSSISAFIDSHRSDVLFRSAGINSAILDSSSFCSAFYSSTWAFCLIFTTDVVAVVERHCPSPIAVVRKKGKKLIVRRAADEPGQTFLSDRQGSGMAGAGGSCLSSE